MSEARQEPARRSRRAPFIGLAIVTAVVIALVVVVLTQRGEQLSDRAYFTRHRRDFDRIEALVRSGRLSAKAHEQYYGPKLPPDLRYLSATEKVTIYPDGRFFVPSWTGTPDDAGGYWFSPRSPEGEDMYGMRCSDPTSLRANWWVCMMRA